MSRVSEYPKSNRKSHKGYSECLPTRERVGNMLTSMSYKHKSEVSYEVWKRHDFYKDEWNNCWIRRAIASAPSVPSQTEAQACLESYQKQNPEGEYKLVKSTTNREFI